MWAVSGFFSRLWHWLSALWVKDWISSGCGQNKTSEDVIWGFGKHWPTFFKNFWHCMDQTNPLVENIIKYQMHQQSSVQFCHNILTWTYLSTNNVIIDFVRIAQPWCTSRQSCFLTVVLSCVSAKRTGWTVMEKWNVGRQNKSKLTNRQKPKSFDTSAFEKVMSSVKSLSSVHWGFRI